MTDAPPLAVLECSDITAMAMHIRALAEAQQVSRRMMDEQALWAEGFAEKALADPPLKPLGAGSMFVAAALVGYKIALVPDPEAISKLARLKKRREPQARSGALHWRYARLERMMQEILTEWRSKGGRAARDALTPQRRSEIARRAAVIRWQLWRRERKERAKAISP